MSRAVLGQITNFWLALPTDEGLEAWPAKLEDGAFVCCVDGACVCCVDGACVCCVDGACVYGAVTACSRQLQVCSKLPSCVSTSAVLCGGAQGHTAPKTGIFIKPSSCVWMAADIYGRGGPIGRHLCRADQGCRPQQDAILHVRCWLWSANGSAQMPNVCPSRSLRLLVAVVGEGCCGQAEPSA